MTVTTATLELISITGLQKKKKVHDEYSDSVCDKMYEVDNKWKQLHLHSKEGMPITQI